MRSPRPPTPSRRVTLPGPIEPGQPVSPGPLPTAWRPCPACGYRAVRRRAPHRAGGHRRWPGAARVWNARPPPGSGLADVIVADIAAHAVHPSGRWQRSREDPGLDAALLLVPVRRAVPADDPRTQQTLRGYLEEIIEDGYAYRFRHDERPLAEAEGAFPLCGLILALCPSPAGQRGGRHALVRAGPGGLRPTPARSPRMTQRQLRGQPAPGVRACAAAPMCRLPGRTVARVKPAGRATVRCDRDGPG